TYHGPGQLVGYPILKLPHRLEVKRLVTDLEEVILRTCADFGIDATREGPERGVWVGGKKIASIGLAVHRNVTFHGFALNVTTDLREFLKIRPCGDRAALEGLQLADHLGDDLEQIADDAVVRDFEQRRLRIDVDDDDLLRLLHAGEMLDGTADADGQVKLRPDRHPRLADLQHLRYPTAVDGLARCRDRAAEQVRELLEHREVLRVPEAVATAHHDVGFLGTEAPLLREFLKVHEGRVDVRGPELHGLWDDLAGPLRVVRGRDKDVPPHRSHLRTVLLAEDVGQALPAEARPDHVEVALRIDVELDAVGRQAGLEDCVKAASEVPSVLRRAIEDDLRFVAPDQLRHHLGVRPRTVNLEDRIVDDDHAVQAVADRMLREVVDSVSQEDSGQRRRPQVREAPAFADQLHAHVSQSLLAVLE